MEQYLPIPNFSRYMVSNIGNVKAISYKGSPKETILKPYQNKDGYLAIGITNDYKKRCNCFISRLVAIAFIPNPENKPEVDHLDRNITNNNVENLRWATRQEQNKNRGSFSNTGESNISKVVKEYYYVSVLGHKKKSFPTIDEAIEYRNKCLNTSL